MARNERLSSLTLQQPMRFFPSLHKAFSSLDVMTFSTPDRLVAVVAAQQQLPRSASVEGMRQSAARFLILPVQGPVVFKPLAQSLPHAPAGNCIIPWGESRARKQRALGAARLEVQNKCDVLLHAPKRAGVCQQMAPGWKFTLFDHDLVSWPFEGSENICNGVISDNRTNSYKKKTTARTSYE